jgi:hypothetical protein
LEFLVIVDGEFLFDFDGHGDKTVLESRRQSDAYDRLYSSSLPIIRTGRRCLSKRRRCKNVRPLQFGSRWP